MSVREEREEDRNKNCSSRGLGVAAAAIGVGVGAALYCFFSKRENPADEGATSSGWSREEALALDSHDSSYTTISEHSTTDTSMHDTSMHDTSFEDSCNSTNIMQAISRRLWNNSHSNTSDEQEYTVSSDEEVQYNDENSDLDESMTEQNDFDGIGSDSETNQEWDVTTSSLDVPVEETRARSPIMMQFGELTVRLLNPQDSGWKSAAGEMSRIRQRAFRERSWTLEECSICFEVMLKEQEVMALPCTHRFHQACVLPWLQQRQTCPNCRKES